MLRNMTHEQAREWELFTRSNPNFEDKLMIQIAAIARIFASVFIKKSGGAVWTIEDFIPKFGEIDNGKKVSKNLKNKFIDMLTRAGDEKAKKWAKNQAISVKKPEMIKGTNGKLYKYALEEYANNTRPPRSLRK